MVFFKNKNENETQRNICRLCSGVSALAFLVFLRWLRTCVRSFIA